MSAALSKKAKNDIKKDFLKLMGNPVLAKLWKMWENVDTSNLTQQKKRRRYLVSETNYHTPFFSEILLAIKLKKTQINMSKPVISILKLK